jgi:hypothetical protein
MPGSPRHREPGDFNNVKSSLPRRIVSEGVGTAMLLAAVVGSGIMGERLAGGNVAIALLANTLATGAALVTLVLTFGSVSGAHFNPAVSLADASQGGLSWTEAGRTSFRKRSGHLPALRSRTRCLASRSMPGRGTFVRAARRS